MLTRTPRAWLPVACVVLTLAAGFWLTTPDLAARSSGIEQKGLLVTVLDDKGAPIKDLKPEEFMVFEDGTQRTIVSAERATEPLSIEILVDTAKPTMGASDPIRDVRDGLTAFVRTVHAAQADAAIALTEFGGAGIRIRNFTDKTSDLESSINRLVMSQRSSAVLLEALLDSAKDLAKRKGPRRAIVSIDFASTDSSRISVDELQTAVQEAGPTIWAISIRGAGGGSPAMRDSALDILTEHTGGIRNTVASPTTLKALMTTLAETLTSQYVVIYERPSGPASDLVVPVATRGAKFLRQPWVE